MPPSQLEKAIQKTHCHITLTLVLVSMDVIAPALTDTNYREICDDINSSLRECFKVLPRTKISRPAQLRMHVVFGKMAALLDVSDVTDEEAVRRFGGIVYMLSWMLTDIELGCKHYYSKASASFDKLLNSVLELAEGFETLAPEAPEDGKELFLSLV